MAGDSDSGFDSAHERVGASDPWVELASSADPKSVAMIWLELQSRIVGTGVLQGVVVLGAADHGPFTPLAVWPEGTMGSPALVAAIEGAIQKSRTVTIGGDDARPRTRRRNSRVDAVACPLLVDKQICGAVGFEVEHRSAAELQKIADALKWGSGWLELLVRQRKSNLADRLVSVVELTATALQHERFQGAATAVATELAGTLLCERVSIGFLKASTPGSLRFPIARRSARKPTSCAPSRRRWTRPSINRPQWSIRNRARSRCRSPAHTSNW